MKIKRRFYIIKCRAHVLFRNLAEKFFVLLAKWRLVVEHKKTYSNVFDEGNPQNAPDIKTNRFLYKVSFLIQTVETVAEYWFETKKGRKLFIVFHNHHKEKVVTYRAELKSFFAHFSPRQRMWVHRESPIAVLYPENPTAFSFPKDPNVIEKTTWDTMQYKTVKCDFHACRIMCKYTFSPEVLATSFNEVFSSSLESLKHSLTEKVSEINETLTGVKNDGELTSPSNKPIAENIICRKCGYPVFASAKDKYGFECIHCGELVPSDILRVDHRRYEDVMLNCMEELEYFLSVRRTITPLGVSK